MDGSLPLQFYFHSEMHCPPMIYVFAPERIPNFIFIEHAHCPPHLASHLMDGSPLQFYFYSEMHCPPMIYAFAPERIPNFIFIEHAHCPPHLASHPMNGSLILFLFGDALSSLLDVFRQLSTSSDEWIPFTVILISFGDALSSYNLGTVPILFLRYNLLDSKTCKQCM
jgi:hypothetical protein